MFGNPLTIAPPPSQSIWANVSINFKISDCDWFQACNVDAVEQFRYIIQVWRFKHSGTQPRRVGNHHFSVPRTLVFPFEAKKELCEILCWLLMSQMLNFQSNQNRFQMSEEKLSKIITGSIDMIALGFHLHWIIIVKATRTIHARGVLHNILMCFCSWMERF